MSVTTTVKCGACRHPNPDISLSDGCGTAMPYDVEFPCDRCGAWNRVEIIGTIVGDPAKRGEPATV